MKKAYIKPEMEIQEFAAEDMIMSGASATCPMDYVVSDCPTDFCCLPSYSA